MSKKTGNVSLMPEMNSMLLGLRNKQRGALSIEFAFVVIAIITIFFFVVEMCRIIYISSAMDVSVSEASRYSSMENGQSVNYSEIFGERLNKDVPLWPLLTSSNRLSVEVAYCNTIQDATYYVSGVNRNGCNSVDSNTPLAIYTVTYNYELIFPTMFSVLQKALVRNVIYVQEYQKQF